VTAAPVVQAVQGGVDVRPGVNSHLTSNRPVPPASTSRKGSRRRRHEDVENDAYLVFVARVITAAGKRVALGDVDALPDLAKLSADLDAALITAVTGLRGFGYSWEQIASRLGVTRQAAQQRWGGKP
jgi:DNA-directed RNA polymerase specialized sigma24 family protein